MPFPAPRHIRSPYPPCPGMLFSRFLDASLPPPLSYPGSHCRQCMIWHGQHPPSCRSHRGTSMLSPGLQLYTPGMVPMGHTHMLFVFPTVRLQPGTLRAPIAVPPPWTILLAVLPPVSVVISILPGSLSYLGACEYTDSCLLRYPFHLYHIGCMYSSTSNAAAAVPLKAPLIITAARFWSAANLLALLFLSVAGILLLLRSYHAVTP
jgi:hypothetical protein